MDGGDARGRPGLIVAVAVAVGIVVGLYVCDSSSARHSRRRPTHHAWSRGRQRRWRWSSGYDGGVRNLSDARAWASGRTLQDTVVERAVQPPTPPSPLTVAEASWNQGVLESASPKARPPFAIVPNGEAAAECEGLARRVRAPAPILRIPDEMRTAQDAATSRLDTSMCDKAKSAWRVTCKYAALAHHLAKGATVSPPVPVLARPGQAAPAVRYTVTLGMQDGTAWPLPLPMLPNTFTARVPPASRAAMLKTFGSGWEDVSQGVITPELYSIALGRSAAAVGNVTYAGGGTYNITTCLPDPDVYEVTTYLHVQHGVLLSQTKPAAPSLPGFCKHSGACSKVRKAGAMAVAYTDQGDAVRGTLLRSGEPVWLGPLVSISLLPGSSISRNLFQFLCGHLGGPTTGNPTLDMKLGGKCFGQMTCSVPTAGVVPPVRLMDLLLLPMRRPRLQFATRVCALIFALLQASTLRTMTHASTGLRTLSNGPLPPSATVPASVSALRPCTPQTAGYVVPGEGNYFACLWAAGGFTWASNSTPVLDGYFHEVLGPASQRGQVVVYHETWTWWEAPSILRMIRASGFQGLYLWGSKKPLFGMPWFGSNAFLRSLNNKAREYLGQCAPLSDLASCTAELEHKSGARHLLIEEGSFGDVLLLHGMEKEKHSAFKRHWGWACTATPFAKMQQVCGDLIAHVSSWIISAVRTCGGSTVTATAK
eukprot:gene8537-1527_t